MKQYLGVNVILEDIRLPFLSLQTNQRRGRKITAKLLTFGTSFSVRTLLNVEPKMTDTTSIRFQLEDGLLPFRASLTTPVPNPTQASPNNWRRARGKGDASFPGPCPSQPSTHEQSGHLDGPLDCVQSTLTLQTRPCGSERVQTRQGHTAGPGSTVAGVMGPEAATSRFSSQVSARPGRAPAPIPLAAF